MYKYYITELNISVFIFAPLPPQLYEAALALSFLHHDTHPMIIHGDVKPGNILVSDDGHAVLTDIGMGSFPELPPHNSSRNTGLSWRYAPPELLPSQDLGLDSKPCEAESGAKSINLLKTRETDVYSFAITAYEVSLPFSQFDQSDLTLKWLGYYRWTSF